MRWVRTSRGTQSKYEIDMATTAPVPPDARRCYQATMRAGIEQLAKPSANLGMRPALAAFARMLDPARPCFFGKLGTAPLAYTSALPQIARRYDSAPPACAEIPAGLSEPADFVGASSSKSLSILLWADGPPVLSQSDWRSTHRSN